MNALLATTSNPSSKYVQPQRSYSRPSGRYAPTGMGYLHAFFAAYTRWVSETTFESNPRNIVSHPSFVAIVEMARMIPDVVSLIADELRSEPSMLVWVLDEAFQIQPYDESNAGNIRKMSEAWVNYLD